MPNKQIRTNDNFLQRDFEGTNNKRQSANNKISGNNNVVSFENNMVAGDRNSAAGKTIILGDNNLVGNPSRVAVIGRDNILTSVDGMIIGASNSITTPVKNLYLFGVDGLSMTQSVNNVWIFGNPPLGTYSIGTQSFQNTLIAPTQSGIYFYQNVFLGPGVNIFNNNGSTLNQNLNSVLTVGNTTGGEDIEVTTGDLIKGQSQGVINFDLGSRFILSYDTSYANSIVITSDTISIGSAEADIEGQKFSEALIQTVGAAVGGTGFFNGAPVQNNLTLNKVNSFRFYVNGINTTATLGYYGELKVAYRVDGVGNITQIGAVDLYEVSEFTTVTIGVNNFAAQFDFECTGEAGETINFNVKWVKIQ
jgi:hypothetical protein